MYGEVLREYWMYRELFYFLAWRDVKVRYKQTVLGIGWAIIQPFLSMIVFTILFGKLGKMPNDGIPYPVFYFAALLPWMYFSTTLSTSSNSLVSNANLITKVYFPRMILPSSSAVSGLVDFSIGCVLLVGILAYYQMSPGWGILLWPLMIMPLVVLALGVSMMLAALNVRYRDIKYTVPFFLQIWLFVTPVIYPSSMVPEKFRALMALNPLAGIIDTFRASIVPEKPIDWQLLTGSLLLTVVIFSAGCAYFRKTERSFADIV